MTLQFDRKVSLVVAPRGESGTPITDLRITFAVEKTSESKPNTAKIVVYNLSAASRALMERKNTAVVLNAGYLGQIKTIFLGDVARITHRREGADISTTIETGDGELAYTTDKLDVSFAPGTKFRQIFDTLKNAMPGITEGQVKGFNLNDQVQNGMALSGPVKNHLDTLTKKQNLEWSIQNGQLQILPPDVGTDEEVIVLNSSTGLIDTPFKTKVINQSLLKKKDGLEADDGVQCTALLNGDIRPGRRIKIESKFVSGVFKVDTVKMYGDTHGKPWYSEIEAR